MRALLWGVSLTALFAMLAPAARAVESDEVLRILRAAKNKGALNAVLFGLWVGDEEILTVALGESMPHVPATQDMHFRVGGVTLTCVSTLLLQLADQGKLSPDDNLTEWFPDLPRADRVTLRMLANCTSGYPDYVRSEAFIKAFYNDPFREWRAEELIDAGLSTPMLYAPGEGWNYSHTNFVILGEAIAKATGESIPSLLGKHIFDPLKLQDTDYPLSPALRQPVIHAYSMERDVYEDSTYWDPSWTSHSGRMTSNLKDLGVLARAIGQGRLLKPESYQQQLAPTTVGLGRNKPDLYYGMGVIMMNGWMVQNPRFGGYNMILAHLPSKDISIVVLTTVSDRSDPNVAYATELFKEIVRYVAPGNRIPEVVR